MLLRCEPEALDFGEAGEAVLRLYNTSAAAACVAYKVRTTAPQRFAVSPVIGLLGPSGCVNVRGE